MAAVIAMLSSRCGLLLSCHFAPMTTRRFRERNRPAVFTESIDDRRLPDQIARETGAVIGGTLYTGALSEPDGPAGTY